MTTPTYPIVTPGPSDLTFAEQDRVIAAARITDEEPRRAAMLTIAHEMKQQHLAAVDQREQMARTLDSVRTLLSDARTELAEFKRQVRDVAIRVADEQGWCDSGLNDVLDELGLERKVTSWDVRVEVTMRHTITVTVEASSEDFAIDAVSEDDVREAMQDDVSIDPHTVDGFDFECEDARPSDG